MTENKNFTIHSLAPEGLEVVVRAESAITAVSKVLYPGDPAIEITEAIFELNADRNSSSWLTLTSEQQLARWGKIRFGLGEPSAEVLAAAKAKRDVRLRAERDALLRSNPRIAKKSGAEQRIALLDVAIGDKS